MSAPAPIRLIFSALALSPLPAVAVIFDSTGDPGFNTTAPTGSLRDSGWQFQGQFGGFLGTPIASNLFITAEHIGGSVGQSFAFGGIDYLTDKFFDDPASDLRIWRIDGTFPTFAPLYTKGDEAGKALLVFGRGTQRGSELRDTLGFLHGWAWGGGDGVQRWGTNAVTATPQGGEGIGSLLAADFNHIGGTEAHLSVGDSGGGLFIRDGNTWKLAGINYAVTGPYFTSMSGAGETNAALYDQSTYFTRNGLGTYSPATGPGSFFSSRISSNIDFISRTVAANPIPEPSTLVFLLTASALLGLRPRRA